MGRLSHRRYGDDSGAQLRLRVATSRHVFTRAWQMLLLFVMSALGWACGSDPVCPTGTSGTQCSPSDDLGAAPDVPAATRDRANDDPLSSDTPDAGTTDVEGAIETETTTQFLREVPDRHPLASPHTRERGGGLVLRSDHATDHERAAKCAALAEEHVDSRGAPPWRSLIYVERGRAHHGWRSAA